MIPALEDPSRVWRARGKESPSFGGKVSAFESLVAIFSRRGDQTCWLSCTLAGQLQGQKVSAELWRWDARQYGEGLDRG